jgi:hypothetical protein
MATDWNRHSAIAGYGTWVLSTIGIIVAVWLAFRRPAGAGIAASQQEGASNNMSAMWVLLAVSVIYAVGIAVAAGLNVKAKPFFRYPPNITNHATCSRVTFANYRTESRNG